MIESRRKRKNLSIIMTNIFELRKIRKIKKKSITTNQIFLTLIIKFFDKTLITIIIIS